MKTAWITGASKGIGAAVALLLAQKGYQIIVHYEKDHQSAVAVKEKIEAYGVSALLCQGDVSKEEDVKNVYEQAIERFSKIDVLINNAGISQQQLFTDYRLDEWQRMMDVHVTGTFLCSRIVLPSMISRKSGKIINMSSIWGIAGGSCEVAYSTAKAAIIGMSKALAKEVAPCGITVNCVAPGAVDTEMMSDFSEDEKEAFFEQIPVGRMASPMEIASLIAFLCENDYITGQVISPNGGMFG